MVFNLSVMKARFQVRENYYTLKNRGFVVSELIPLAQSPTDPLKKTYLLKDKYSIFINSDSIYSILHQDSVKISYQKDAETIGVNVSEEDSTLEWTFYRGDNDDVKKVKMSKSETFFTKEFLKYSIPYVYGWFAVGDPRLCEMNLVGEQEIKDPFENI